MYKGYNYRVITEYLDGVTNDFIYIRMIGSKREIYMALKKYASYYPNRKSEIDDIISNLDELLKSTKKMPAYVQTLNDYFDGKISFRTVRMLGTKKQVVEMLKKYKEYNQDRISDIDNIINDIDNYFIESRLVPKYIRYINTYLEGKIDFKELSRYFKGKRILIENLEKYKIKFPDKTDEIDNIINNIDNLKKEVKEEAMYVKTINAYLEGNASFDEVRNLGSISYIKNRLNKFLELNPSKEDEIEEMFIKLDSYYKDTKVLSSDTIITRYINGFITNDELCRLYTKDIFLTKLKNYVIKHPDNKEYVISIINNIDNIYQLNSKEKHLDRDFIKKSSDRKSKDKDLMNDILYSSLSIEEYCSKTGASIEKIKKLCVKYIKSENLDKRNIGTSLLERSSSIFLTKLKYDVLTILTKDDADIFDYLSITRLSTKDFRETMKGIISHEMIIDILSKVDLYRINPSRIDPADNLHTIVNKEAKMNCKIVINGREISKEEKEKVFNFLEENNYPLCLFNSALKKYVNGKLKIDDKVLIKKSRG
ncbi:MAG: hypothetical protein J6G98_04635 [Bacilli bacterium]|nr:hypothetical protein [Bacilli bacterium]